MFSGFDCFWFWLILYLLPNKIDFVLSSPKWVLNLLSTNQPQSILKFLFGADSISVISLCWNIKQVSSAYSNSSQATSCGVSFMYRRKRSGGSRHRRLPGSGKVFLIWTLNSYLEDKIWTSLLFLQRIL